jgi:hypothetical protein
LAPLPVAVADALVTLLDSERSSIFRLTGENSPYLNNAAPNLRKLLQTMADESVRNEHELADLLRPGDGAVVNSSRVRPDPSYLEFLSLKFMLPKLANAKGVLIRYYENALRALGNDGAEVKLVLRRHLNQHEADLSLLKRAAADLSHHSAGDNRQ